MAALVNFYRFALTALFASLPLLGQSLVSPPTLLVFHSATRSLRPVVGIPGSSYLGGSICSNLDFASVAPNQKTAVLVGADGTRLVSDLADLLGDPAPRDPIASAVDQVLWATDSSAAVLVSSSERSLQWVVSGQVALPVSLADLDGDIRLLAADSRANAIVLAVGNRLFRATQQSPLALIAKFGNPTAAAMDRSGEIIFVADATARQLFKMHGDNGGYALTPLLQDQETVEQPVAVALSADGSKLYVADQASRSVTAYQATDGALIGRLALEQAPTSLRMLSRETFLLNEHAPVGASLSVLKAGDRLAEFFIPTGDKQ